MAVKHLTEAEFADREGVSAEAAANWRRDGTGPAYLLISESKTKQTIRYREVDIEAWEMDRLRSAREPQPA